MSLLKIGEVAKKTGLTVRALHHYDEIGLFSASHRSEAGYRMYTRDDLMQLQKIKSLQQLGFSLDEIGSLLEDSSNSLPNIIDKHIHHLTQQVEQQQVLIKQLQSFAHVLKQDSKPSVEVLLKTLEVTTMFEKYYSAEQMEQLAERRKAIGDDAIIKAQEEWQTIFEAFRELLQNNEPASCETAQQLARRSLELIEMFTGGDAGIRKSLQNMYDSEGGDKVLSQSGDMNVDKALFDYYSEAMEIVKKS